MRVRMIAYTQVRVRTRGGVRVRGGARSRMRTGGRWGERESVAAGAAVERARATTTRQQAALLHAQIRR